MNTPVVQHQQDAAVAEPLADHLRLNLAEHGIAFVMPRGARFAGTLDLPCGALIHGVVQGRIRCEQGSLVFAPGSEFAGEAEANMVYLCGDVKSQRTGAPTVITGKTLLSVGKTATGRAQLSARQFAICTSRFAGTMQTIE